MEVPALKHGANEKPTQIFECHLKHTEKLESMYLVNTTRDGTLECLQGKGQTMAGHLQNISRIGPATCRSRPPAFVV